MKYRLWQIGLAIFLGSAGMALTGGTVLALSISDLPATGSEHPNSGPLDGAAAAPVAVGDAVRKHLRLLNSRRAPVRRNRPPGKPRLGVDNLIGFMIDADRFARNGINIRFNLDRRQALDWMRFWTDIAFNPETEQSYDYRAIALAAYAPEIRYWLDGTRWASFDNDLPRESAAVEGGAVEAGAGAAEYTTVGPNIYAAGIAAAGAAKKKAGRVKAKTLTEFVLSIGYKIFRQPIVYLILMVFAGILFASTRQQSSV